MIRSLCVRFIDIGVHCAAYRNRRCLYSIVIVLCLEFRCFYVLVALSIDICECAASRGLPCFLHRYTFDNVTHRLQLMTTNREKKERHANTKVKTSGSNGSPVSCPRSAEHCGAPGQPQWLLRLVGLCSYPHGEHGRHGLSFSSIVCAQ